jgi:hypothetical protein
MITRMVFGSFPMLVSNRTAIKVHSLKWGFFSFNLFLNYYFPLIFLKLPNRTLCHLRCKTYILLIIY